VLFSFPAHQLPRLLFLDALYLNLLDNYVAPANSGGDVPAFYAG
jgi:hypothetical protein